GPPAVDGSSKQDAVCAFPSDSDFTADNGLAINSNWHSALLNISLDDLLQNRAINEPFVFANCPPCGALKTINDFAWDVYVLSDRVILYEPLESVASKRKGLDLFPRIGQDFLQLSRDWISDDHVFQQLTKKTFGLLLSIGGAGV